jgi:hypothetical protein
VIPIGVEDMLLAEEGIRKLPDMLDFVKRYLTAGNKIGRGISFQNLLTRAIEARTKSFLSTKEGVREFKTFRDNFVNQVHTVISPCVKPKPSSTPKSRVPPVSLLATTSGGDTGGAGGSGNTDHSDTIPTHGTGTVISTTSGIEVSSETLDRILGSETVSTGDDGEGDITMDMMDDQELLTRQQGDQSLTLALMTRYSGVPSERKPLPIKGCGTCDGCKSNNAENILVGIISIVLIATSPKTELCRDLHERLAGGHVDSFKMLDSWLIDQDKNFNLLANDRTHLTIRTRPQTRQALHASESGSHLDLSINHKYRYTKDYPTTGAFTTTWEQYLRGDLPCLRHNPEFVANHPSRCCVLAERESAWRKAIKAEELRKSG